MSVHKFARQQQIEAAKLRGVVALQCEKCGYKHPLTRLGFGCNAAHPEQDGETCEGWNLREVKADAGTVTA